MRTQTTDLPNYFIARLDPTNIALAKDFYQVEEVVKLAILVMDRINNPVLKRQGITMGIDSAINDIIDVTNLGSGSSYSEYRAPMEIKLFNLVEQYYLDIIETLAPFQNNNLNITLKYNRQLGDAIMYSVTVADD